MERITRTRPTVQLSPVTYGDIPDMAWLFLYTFEKDEHRPALVPHRVGLSTAEVWARDGPLEERRLRRALVGKDLFMKATVRSTDSEGIVKDTIVGWAKWTAPSGVRRRSLWEWLWSEILYPLYDFIVRPAVSIGLPEGARKLIIAQREEVFGSGGIAEGRTEWYLHIICVHPDWQGYGIGGKLIGWGMMQAKVVDAVVYLESTSVGLPFYMAKGFRVASERGGEVNGVYLKLPGMIWEPRMASDIKF